MDDQTIAERRDLTLEALRFACMQRFSGSLLRDTKIEMSTLVDTFLDEAAIRFEKIIYGTQLGEKVVPVRFDVPATPWQHFKQRYLPTLVRYRPVKLVALEKTVRFQSFDIFPESTIAVPELGKPVRFVQDNYS